MLKVILIDDEIVILQGLKKLIDWSKLELEIVGEAMDGLEGLSLIEEVRPDIVISDITMPNLNGIEMLKAINEKNYDLKTLFLSGYQEFIYVQEAIRYGAVDYLLKPVTEDNLIMVLKRIIGSIKEERSYHHLKKQEGVKEQEFRQLLMANNTKCTVEQFWPGGRKEVIAVAIKLLWKKSDLNVDENLSIMKYEIYDYLQSCLEKQNNLLIKKDSNAFSALIQLNECDNFQEVVLALEKEVLRKYPVKFIVGVSNKSTSVVKLYESAKRALDLYYFTEEKFCHDGTRKNIEVNQEQFQAQYYELTQSIMMNHDVDIIVDTIVDTVGILKDIHYGNRSSLINECVLLIGQIYLVLNDCGLVDDTYQNEQLSFIENIQSKLSFNKLISAIKDYYQQLFLKIQLLSGLRESQEITKIKQYINERYNENITLEQLADYIGMNAAYLSTFFKKETGQNFKNYLTIVRMKEALRLLNSTDLKSYELASRVGYNDPKQFRKKFKEIFGVSPQQYRKQEKD